MWGDALPEGQSDDRWHVPIASDLCSAVSELAFSDPPQIKATDPAAQDRIAEYVDDGLFDVAAGGTEVGAALGGHYLQAVMPDDADHAQLECIAYDGAWPVFSRGRLVSVAFWWVLDASNNTVWRHFEQHELAGGDGVIRHALFEGTPSNVGTRMPLTARPETAVLGAQTEVVISTGPGLDVVHIPARSPQRLWRTHSLGRHLGRSIFQGLEPSFSNLDKAYTSWMRDLELGRSRLLIAQYLLEQNGPGGGGRFDAEQKLFVPLEMQPNIGAGGGTDPIRMVQFAIRVDEHQKTTQEIVETILRGASFSAQTFGEDENGNAMTATGVVSKDSRTMRTRRRMLAPESTGLQIIVRKMLAMDDVPDDTVDVSFPDGAEEQPLVIAQTVQALRTAQAISLEMAVRMQHEDWDDDRVQLEVDAIQAETAATALADPFARPTVTAGGQQPANQQPADTGPPITPFPGTN
jgi:A118 family predicted phage portal protein